jgi:hypothetical protein
VSSLGVTYDRHAGGVEVMAMHIAHGAIHALHSEGRVDRDDG